MEKNGGGILKRWLILILVLFIVSSLPICASAHPGRTDENGGHYDRETGEYHYHHGHPAHNHYDIDGDGFIDCPYDFVDKTGQNSGSSSSSSRNSTKNTTAPTESKSEVKTGKMDNFIIIAVMIAVCALVVRIQASLHRDEKESLEELNQDKELKNKKLLNDLTAAERTHESDKETISSLQAEVSRLSGADRKCEIYKERYNALLDMLQRKNPEALLGRYSVDCPISKEALEQINLKIVIPSNVVFGDDGLPIFLDHCSSGYYGGYTVYSSFNGNIYHADSLCGGYNTHAVHLFHAINCGKRLCRKCAKQLKVPDAIPDWYLALQEIRSKTDE